MTKFALVTHALHFAGPAAVDAMTADGYTVVVHDASFVDESSRNKYESEHPGTIAIAEQKPGLLVTAALEHAHAIDTVVSNDYIPAPMNRLPLEGTSEDDIRLMFEACSIFPMLMLQGATSPMRAAGGGTVIFITSSVGKSPLAFNPIYGPVRAATVALVESAAKTLTRDGIYLYAIGPNFFSNPTYFPESQWDEDPAARERVERDVPLGRLGRPDEMGALITFLASRRSVPLVGQFFAFTGGYLP